MTRTLLQALEPDAPAPRRWRLDDIPWEQTRSEAVAGSEELFYMVTTASLIESATDRYARNLADHYSGEPDIADWLLDGWEPEEMQHGRALRRYAEAVWPDFPWEQAFEGFRAEFSEKVKPESLLPKRSLEMAARCVVEMGTASYYTALSRASADPVLSEVARHIFEDEVGHYKHFYRYFQRLRGPDGVSRAQVAGALWHRLRVTRGEDTDIALKHVRRWRFPGEAYDVHVYRDVVKRCRRLAARHFPHQMAVKMLLRPLDLAPRAQRGLERVVETVARHAII
jgi:hypothetical protein